MTSRMGAMEAPDASAWAAKAAAVRSSFDKLYVPGLGLKYPRGLRVDRGQVGSTFVGRAASGTPTWHCIVCDCQVPHDSRAAAA